MTRRRHDTEEGIAAAQEEQERIEKLNSRGLCHNCGDRPQNPAINASLCMSCYIGEDFVGCDHKDCINSPVGNFRQGQYCEVHLTDRIHTAYDAYITRKAELEEQEQKLEDYAATLEVDPRDTDVPRPQWPDNAVDFEDEWTAHRLDLQELEHTRSIIKKAIENVEQPFPKGYNAFCSNK